MNFAVKKKNTVPLAGDYKCSYKIAKFGDFNVRIIWSKGDLVGKTS